MNVAYNRDCVEAMKEYPDKYFDLAVVDPPYGINVGSQPGGVTENTFRSEAPAIQSMKPSRERERERRESAARSPLVRVGGENLSSPKAIPPSMTAPYRRRGISKNWSEYQSTALSSAAITSLTTSAIQSA